MDPLIKTERLYLRPWTYEDEAAFIELCHRPGFNDFSVGSYSDMTPEKAKAFFDRDAERFSSKKVGRFGVFLKSGDLIGVAGLFSMAEPYLGSFEINFRFPHEYRGQGFATESVKAILNYAKSTLGRPDLYAVVNPENQNSKKLLNKIGMRSHGLETYRGKTFEIWKTDL